METDNTKKAVAPIETTASEIAPSGTIEQSENTKISDTINKIVEEVEAIEHKPQYVGIYKIASMNDTIDEASKRKNPEQLFGSLWYENELCFLFADTNAGKSILAMQIACDVAKKRKVVYFDYELSDKQQQLRYTDENTGKLFTFPDALLRVSIDTSRIKLDTNFEEEILSGIEAVIIETQSDVVIIDNLTYICANVEKGDVAGSLMVLLKQLQTKLNISMLILTHTPKRNETEPITINDLAGSKKQANFADSIFAIGKSGKDDNLRYIKQLKIRSGEKEFGATNVLVYELEKEDAFLYFKQIGYERESEHLKPRDDNYFEQQKIEIRLAYKKLGSIRKVAEQFKISKSKVQRIMKECPTEGQGTNGTNGTLF